MRSRIAHAPAPERVDGRKLATVAIKPRGMCTTPLRLILMFVDEKKCITKIDVNMKETDLTVIQNAAIDELSANGSELLSYLTSQEVVDVFTMIYLTNDQLSGHGIDFVGNLSIVASTQRIAIIFLGHHSFYKHVGPLCEYDDIEVDMHVINMVMDAALERWSDQNE